jgi:hypothetical protein
MSHGPKTVSTGCRARHELAQDGEWYGGQVVYVTDEHDNEIGRVPVVTAIKDNSL